MIVLWPQAFHVTHVHHFICPFLSILPLLLFLSQGLWDTPGPDPQDRRLRDPFLDAVWQEAHHQCAPIWPPDQMWVNRFHSFDFNLVTLFLNIEISCFLEYEFFDYLNTGACDKGSVTWQSFFVLSVYSK